ncbi:DUF262 domain-containing protein (plasmid) [Segatella hominis]|uniref:DUF262 domain-containing protein n=1 Tax=Segatella hominis TaxID=2518605 RepID=UPI001C451614|nr:DUF262 domain-containing protein [Segatella hominis]WOZ83135.1 DUF262 domain-containing protein [Segatella hominis]
MSSNKINLGEYIRNRTIEIPCYQRGYIWGKKHDGSRDSVTYMLDTLKKGFDNNKKDIFVQGITIGNSLDSPVYNVIDGQQRSTFFYLLLKTLGDSAFNIKYESTRGAELEVSESPQKWLDEFSADTNCDENQKEPTQDVFFFKKTVRLIKSHELFNDKHHDVIEYLYDHIFFLIIPIQEKLAVSTFTMMNGNKANMADYELIKADLLRRASLGTGGYTNKMASEWDNISLRSRYAHEWDRWLHWWNQKEVQQMYNCSNPMGWLLKTVFDVKNESDNLFRAYENYLDSTKNVAKAAKNLFGQLRDCQHRFEIAYTDAVQYNQFGIIMRFIDRPEDKIKFIKNQFASSTVPDVEVKDLHTLYNLLLLGFTYTMISKNDLDQDYVGKYLKAITDGNLYHTGSELAYRYLLVRNVERDSELDRKFDFSIWSNRSLEHVYPKSKVLHVENNEILGGDGKLHPEFEGLKITKKGEFIQTSSIEKSYQMDTFISRASIENAWNTYQAEFGQYENVQVDSISEHSLGNLLLLYKNNNSSFGNKMPEDKRKSYFELNKDDMFASRHLLHTVFSFGRFEKFDQNAICENQKDAILDIAKRIHEVEPLLN